MQSRVILVAEDDPDDAFIFQMMFKRATLPHTLHVVGDGQQVIDWLLGKDGYSDRAKYPLPTDVVLDLKMPVKTGFETLEWIRHHTEFHDLPVIVLSSSDDQKDVKRAYELGATTYFVKSPHLQDVMQYLRRS
jgi:CheY-like chemotaxis protein